MPQFNRDDDKAAVPVAILLQWYRVIEFELNCGWLLRQRVLRHGRDILHGADAGDPFTPQFDAIHPRSESDGRVPPA
jgi:hypothetical protein